MENKKKKKHTGLIVFLSLFTVLIVIPVVAIYACFYDSTTATFVGKDNVDTASLYKAKAVDAFDSTATSHKISFTVGEDDLNQLLYQASQSLPENTKGYLKKFTVSIQDDAYHFYLDATFGGFFQTRIDIKTTLSEVKDAVNPENGSFVFKIEDMKIGRISGMDSLALQLAGSSLNDATLTSLFQNAGLNMEVSLSNKTITYTKKAMIQDLEKQIGGSTNAMYSAILNDFLKDDLLGFDFYSSKTLSVNIALEDLHTNATYCPADKTAPLDVSVFRGQVKTLLDQGAIEADETSEGYVFDYLIRGFDNASDTTKTYLNAKTRDFSSVGISDITAYQGAINYSVSSIPSLVQQDLETSAQAGFTSSTIASVSEDEITAYLETTSIYGYSYILSRPKDDATYKVNAVAVDDFYAQIVNDHLYLIIGVNINGYETSIIFDTLLQPNSPQYQITLKTDKVYYGNKEASGELKACFYDLINQSFADSGWMSFNDDSTSANYGQITLDFSTAITTSAYYPALQLAETAQSKSVAIALSGADIASTGELRLNLE